MTKGDIVRVGGGAAKQLVSAADAVAVLNTVVAAAREYGEVREVERSKREAIEAHKQVALAEIRERSKLFITYLERSFDERDKNFARLFDALDRAMADGSGGVAEILGSIVTLAAASPFKDLHDPVRVREALDDPDHEWQV